MNELILADSDKDVIKALTRKYCKGQGKWAADFIEGKGEGQIFLLHGPPGTGKTWLAKRVKVAVLGEVSLLFRFESR